ncbi:MAG TPA: aldehyde dehydrogenase (NADP(+)) [Acidobacteriaceae bacterium]|jgi:NADP-dependent aldehyde dehydrogenase|nr:aldehyde dehydrogenase (NADP(+)) [Acidobacteriaceae bacterium]
MTELLGKAILGSRRGASTGEPFQAAEPATGKLLGPAFYTSSLEEVNTAVTLAEEAFSTYSQTSGNMRAEFLIRIADGLQAASVEIVQRAHAETALPLPRLEGEMARTANQLRFFANVVKEGSWCMARIDQADPGRTPTPKPDLRSMLRPLGPVAVFGASNFPLAFSVAGGDTASALAAGNPVIVKAHPAHPGTSELVGLVIAEAVRALHLHEGVFSLLFDSGIHVGASLVQHRATQAVAFTGSLAGGKALMQLAASRPNPIPCFAEMGSTNPLLILPDALEQRADAIADGLFASFTSSAGQVCTKPGLIFVPAGTGGDGLVQALALKVAKAPEGRLLARNIGASYQTAIKMRNAHEGMRLIRQSTAQSEKTEANDPFAASTFLFEISADTLLAHMHLAEEVFGPTTLIVRYNDATQLLQAGHALEGQLAIAVHATEQELTQHRTLLSLLERKAGRLIINGYTTGVEVSPAMVHGGPYPSTSDSHTTSVGGMAIYRFARPVCYQNMPQTLLPEELQDANPLGILRMLDGKMTRESIART